MTPPLPEILEPVAHLLEEYAAPCAALVAQEGEAGSGISSRFGGRPFFPEGTAWPEGPNEPMIFLAQVNFAEAHAAVPGLSPLLPRRGLLQLFVNAEEAPWGTKASDANLWACFFHPDPDATPGAEVEGLACPEQAHAIRFVRDLSYPEVEEAPPELGDVLRSDDEMADVYSDFAFRSPAHRLGGFPIPVQGEIFFNVPPDADREDALQEDWMLVLQIDSDPSLDYLWADTGMLYLGMRKADLEQGDLSQPWLILQCH